MRTVVGMEELVKVQIIAEVGVAVESLRTTVGSPFSSLITSKHVNYSMLDFVGDASQGHHLARSSWAFDEELGTEILQGRICQPNFSYRNGELPDGIVADSQ